MKTVLVVEDEPLIARELERTLIRLGYRVPEIAGSGGEALRAITIARPALVLMDVNLKGELDGIATASAIRRRWDVPIIYLTSHSDDATLARAKDTGPHGYLIKPFNERDLRITIEVALSKHELEAEIARRERWFSTTLASIGDAVIAADDGDCITFMNAVAERLTGWPLVEARGRRLSDVFRLVGPDGAALASPIAQAMSRGFAIELPANTRLLARDDQPCEVDDSSAPIVDDRGQLLGGVVVFRDVTARKRVERRLAQSERLAAIGTMAAGMAHELNNPLAAVVVNLDFAIDGLAQAEQMLGTSADNESIVHKLRGLVAALGDAQLGTRRVTRVVQDLTNFARPGPEDQQTLDVPDVLDAAIAAVDASSSGGIVIERRYGTTPYVEANEARLLQVFGNLLAAAIRSVANVQSRARSVIVATRTDDEGRAVIEVRDTGRGIAAGDLKRIFDPFFVAPSSAAGGGLGLGLCHGVVSALGGEITVESEVDRGSVFVVKLPGARGRRVVEPAVPEVAAAKRGRILVIDDDAQLGRVFERVLGGDHDVVVEHDPRSGLARLMAGEWFDLVFCDVMMPGLDGVVLFNEVRATLPELAQRIVFVTGGAVGDAAQAFVASTRNVVLAKPFGPAELRAVVRECLARHAA